MVAQMAPRRRRAGSVVARRRSLQYVPRFEGAGAIAKTIELENQTPVTAVQRLIEDTGYGS